MTQFSDLGLADPIMRAIDDQGYEVPTPIQARVIPLMLEGRDIIGIAQTGTGKTAAFSLPILHRIHEMEGKVKHKSCRALILTPTRELAAQIADTIRANRKHMNATVMLIVGGVKINPQIKAMQRGADIVVATPGRLLDHLNQGNVRLDQAKTVVFDEADQMLDMGFLPDIKRIMERLPATRQSVLMSATMPKQIRQLAATFLDDPAEVSVTPPSRPIERINQSIRLIGKDAKREALVEILGGKESKRSIVFTRTKRGADRVKQYLEKAGISAAAIHGNKSQNQRTRALDGFKDGTVSVLVATDIAARGIDIDDVTHVVNYELPNVPEAYIHRIGRTARAGRSGVAISFCDESEHGLLLDIEKLIGKEFSCVDGACNPARPTGDQKPVQNRNRRGGGGGGGNRGGASKKPKSTAAKFGANNAGAKPKRPNRNRRRRKGSGSLGE